jgi:hypothetical protein
MKRLILVALALVAFAMTTQAQTPRTGTFNGRVLDGASINVMEGALIKLRSVADTTVLRGAWSMGDGKFTIPNVPYGEYTVEVSFVGYRDYHSKVTMNMRNMTVADFYMSAESLRAEGVVVTAPMIRVSMHGDTIIYNPKAFDVAEDADAEAILRQLPGVEVIDGQVKVNGESVQQILVDNKETYGTDVQEVMKTIPANVLESIEVYKKLSDFAETTGINDGNDYTVMNFKTGIKFGTFGDAMAMWGWEKMYAAGARWNLVTGSHRFGVNGGINNTGALSSFRDMSSPGMFGADGSQYGSSSGNKTKNIASGMTYNYEPSEDFRVNTNYRYGKAENELHSSEETRYYSNPLYDRMLSATMNDSERNQHNFGASTRWKIDSRNNINARINGSFSDNDNTFEGEERYFNEAVADAVREIFSDGTSSGEGYSLTGNANYGLKIGDRGRNFAVGVNGSMSKTDSRSHNNSNEIRLNMPDNDFRHRSLNDYDRHGFTWKAEYFEPLSPYLHALIGLNASYEFADNSRNADEWDYLEEKWAQWGTGSGVMKERNFSHRIAPGLIYNKNNNEFQLRAGFVRFDLWGESVLPKAWEDKRNFNGVYANFNYERQLTPQKSVRMRLSTNSETPDIDDLQGIDYVHANGYTVSGGNPGLKTTTTYTSSLSYNAYNTRTSASFGLWLSGSANPMSWGTDKYTVTEPEGWPTLNGTQLEIGQEYTRPINIERTTWSANLGMHYGRPLKPIKSNLNVSFDANYNERPGLVNGRSNTAKTTTFSLNAGIYSNFSEKMNFQLSYYLAPEFTENTNKGDETQRGFANNRGLSQYGRMNFYWLTWKNFVLRADVRYNYMRINQDGQAQDYRSENVMTNLAIGKKVFKGRSGEITLAVNDLFNQSRNDNMRTYNDRVRYTRITGLGRYYSLSFRYRLNNFQK